MDTLAYALAKPGAWRDDPWGEGHNVAKVGAKIFAFCGDGSALGFKGGRSREEADAWLDRWPDHATVLAYIGRHGWNNLVLDGTVPDDEVREAIDRSYELVVATLPKSQRP